MRTLLEEVRVNYPQQFQSVFIHIASVLVESTCRL